MNEQAEQGYRRDWPPGARLPPESQPSTAVLLQPAPGLVPDRRISKMPLPRPINLRTPCLPRPFAMSLARLGRDGASKLLARTLRQRHPEFDPMSICKVPYLLDPQAQASVREGLLRVRQNMSSA